MLARTKAAGQNCTADHELGGLREIPTGSLQVLTHISR